MKGFSLTVAVLRGGEQQFALEVTSFPLTVGASPRSDIVLDDPFVSRQHARITLTRGKLLYTDRSRNGSFWSGERITSRLLESGDAVEIPPFTLRFDYRFDEEDEERLTTLRPLSEMLPAELQRAEAEAETATPAPPPPAATTDTAPPAEVPIATRVPPPPPLPPPAAVEHAPAPGPPPLPELPLPPVPAPAPTAEDESPTSELSVVSPVVFEPSPAPRPSRLEHAPPEPPPPPAPPPIPEQHATSARKGGTDSFQAAVTAMLSSESATPAESARRPARKTSSTGISSPDEAAVLRALRDRQSEEQADSPPEATVLLPLESFTEEPKAWLQVMSGPEELRGQTFPLPNRELTIGRGEQADLHFELGNISRVHAKLSPKPDGKWSLRDLASLNGTFVGERRITVAPLELDEEFRLANAISFRITGDPSRKQQRPAQPPAPPPPVAAPAAPAPAPAAVEVVAPSGTMLREATITSERVGPGGSVLLVAVRGRLDAYNYTELGEVLQQAIDAGERLLLLDLSQLAFIDHTGLGVLVRTTTRLEKAKGQLRLVGVRKKLQEAFALSRLDVMFRDKLSPDRESAIAEVVRRGGRGASRR